MVFDMYLHLIVIGIGLICTFYSMLLRKCNFSLIFLFIIAPALGAYFLYSMVEHNNMGYFVAFYVLHKVWVIWGIFFILFTIIDYCKKPVPQPENNKC